MDEGLEKVADSVNPDPAPGAGTGGCDGSDASAVEADVDENRFPAAEGVVVDVEWRRLPGKGIE